MNRKRLLEAGRFRSVFLTEWGTGGVVASVIGLLEVFLPEEGVGREEMLVRMVELYPGALVENDLTRRGALLLERYFAGQPVIFDLPLDLCGTTPFQQQVYAAVVKIPPAVVKSYTEIAREIGRPLTARGVGQAMAANPLPIVIPCHRVLGRTGAMTGYSGTGGVVTKRRLLVMEGVPVSERENGLRRRKEKEK